MSNYHQRKRCRDSSACKDSERPSKRTKANCHGYSPQFWDTLSKITLTRKALKEFDRRTVQLRTESTRVVASATTARLLRSDASRLRDFATNGGPNLSNLRGYAECAPAAAKMSKSSTRSSKRSRGSGLPGSTSKTSTTGPYDPHFEQKFIDKLVYPDGYQTTEGCRPPKPENLDAIRRALVQPRPSLSPSAFSESAFEDFQDTNRRAKSEARAMSTVIPMIAGVKDRQCISEENKLFSNLDKFDLSLRAPQPDKYYGARSSQIEPQVRADLDKYIIPTSDKTLPVAPNYFFEGKSASGRPDVAQRQLMNDNAHGARGMFKMQNYRKEIPEYDGNSYTIGSTYHPGTGTLQLYATHPRQAASGETEYHMTQLDGFQMTGNIDTFRRGAAAFRNSRDFTQEQRDRLIAEANSLANSVPNNTTPSSETISAPPSTTAVSFGSDTSTDELAPEYEDSAKRPRR